MKKKPAKAPMTVRILPPIEKAIRRHAAQHDRAIQAEVNRALFLYYAKAK